VSFGYDRIPAPSNVDHLHALQVVLEKHPSAYYFVHFSRAGISAQRSAVYERDQDLGLGSECDYALRTSIRISCPKVVAASAAFLQYN